MLRKFFIWRGVRKLNKVNPDWIDEINLDTLNMGDPYDCLLGQLYGNYGHGLDDLDIGNGMWYGFDVAAGPNSSHTARELTALWVEKIGQLRAVPEEG